ncbi:MAG: hypothetical protein DMG68_20205 [Acidobacteria bacterium]|nr:MAG: hypothetical protein DMG68_20205 [Acidobacteriota bacterium]
MAFCNACGETLDPTARFCRKCGAANPAAPAVIPAAQPGSAIAPGPPPKNTSTAKIIFIVAAIVVGLGILGIASAVFLGLRIASLTHVRNEGNKQTVETPFGTFETNKNAEEALKNLGIDVYPGARALNSNAATTIGGIKTVSAQFETSDPADKANANVTESGQNQYNIVSTERKSVLTINIKGGGVTTHFQIASVTGRGIGKGDSSN